MSKSFFITTVPEFGHMVIALASSYSEAELKGRCEILSHAQGILDHEKIDTNEVYFVFDDDGVAEKLVRVDGGKCFWSLGNYNVKQLASDVRDAGLV